MRQSGIRCRSSSQPQRLQWTRSGPRRSAGSCFKSPLHFGQRGRSISLFHQFVHIHAALARYGAAIYVIVVAAQFRDGGVYGADVTSLDDLQGCARAAAQVFQYPAKARRVFDGGEVHACHGASGASSMLVLFLIRWAFNGRNVFHQGVYVKKDLSGSMLYFLRSLFGSFFHWARSFGL